MGACGSAEVENPDAPPAGKDKDAATTPETAKSEAPVAAVSEKETAETAKDTATNETSGGKPDATSTPAATKDTAEVATTQEKEEGEQKAATATAELTASKRGVVSIPEDAEVDIPVESSGVSLAAAIVAGLGGGSAPEDGRDLSSSNKLLLLRARSNSSKVGKGKTKGKLLWRKAISALRTQGVLKKKNTSLRDTVQLVMNIKLLEKIRKKEKEANTRASQMLLPQIAVQRHVADELAKECKEYKDISVENVDGEGEDAPFQSYSVLSQQGYIPRVEKPNQDRAIAIHPFMEQTSRALFGVFDGHGPNGHLVSAFVIDTFEDVFAKHRAAKTDEEDMASVAVKAFQECNDTLLKSDIDLEFSGSTGVVVYMEGDKLYCFNVGDSRATLAKKKEDPAEDDECIYEPFKLSNDHKPYYPEEKKRIEAAGGRCEPVNGDAGKVENSRVWLKDVKIPGLAVSRAFGDIVARRVGVDAMPECQEMTLKPGVDAFFMIASDGIWEFIQNEDAVIIASENVSTYEVCKDLIQEATGIWAEEDESRDDITLITVFLKGYEAPKTKKAPADDEE